MPRPVWSGTISFGMVSIPIDLFSATQEKDVRFHQLHKPCGARVKLQKFCPVHKEVVPDTEIVKAYEISKGKYVVMEDDDFASLPIATKHTVTVNSFVKSDEVDPVYFDRSYYARPEDAGAKPYALLVRAMMEKNVIALAQISLRSRESLCLVRPSSGKLVLATLFYPDEIKMAETEASSQPKVDEKELKMATNLIELLEEPFAPQNFHDEYREALLQRIEAKSNGGQVKAAQEAPVETGQVVDLMEALKQSLQAAKSGRKTG